MISIRLPGHSFYWAALVISGIAPCEPVAVTLSKLGAAQYIPPAYLCSLLGTCVTRAGLRGGTGALLPGVPTYKGRQDAVNVGHMVPAH